MFRQFSRFLKSTASGSKQQTTRSLAAEDLGLVVPMIKALAPSKPADSPGTTTKPIELIFDQSPVTRPFVADMLIMYAVDRPTHLEYVSNELAKGSGLTTEELHQLALRNLPNRLEPVRVIDLGSGEFGLAAGGTFEASLLLLPDLWPKLEKYLPGEPLAAVPSHDLLFLIGSQQPEADQLISARARIELEDRRYAISQSVLVRKNNSWQAHAH